MNCKIRSFSKKKKKKKKSINWNGKIETSMHPDANSLRALIAVVLNSYIAKNIAI